MGSQIYIFVSFLGGRPSPSDPMLPNCNKNKLFVIGEYGVSKIVETPLLGCYSSLGGSGFLCVANSRLFFVGGIVENNTINGIMSFDLDEKEPLSNNWKWKTPSLGLSSNELAFASGAVSGDLIYAIGRPGDVLAFDSKTMNVVKSNRLYTDPHRSEMRCYLLAVTETKIYVNCIHTRVKPSDKAYSVFGYLDIDSLNWNVIHHETTNLLFQDKGGVVIGENYLIYFFRYVPHTGKFCPGLYVYDICGDKWLKKPVMNLLKNGFSFPSDAPCSDDDVWDGERVTKYGDSIMYTSLMRIRGHGKPKLAFIWTTLEENNTSVFHVSRFTLNVDGRPTYSAEKVHHVHFSVPERVYDSNSAPS